MDVQMRNRLTGCSAIIDANVVGVRSVPLLCQFFRRAEKCEQSRAFYLSHVEKRPDMALGNEKAVPQGNRITVQNQNGMLVFLDDSAGREHTKRARISGTVDSHAAIVVDDARNSTDSTLDVQIGATAKK